jgi:hypothetical protein
VEASLKIDPSAYRKIALGLRRVEYVLQLVSEGNLPAEESTPEKLGIRQEQLLWLAGKFEGAVKEAAPELPPHERPKEQNPKTVWCQTKDCRGTLTLEQAKSSHFCASCQQKSAAK